MKIFLFHIYFEYSQTFQITFPVPPTLWITHQQVHADIGSTVKLDCLTAAHPPSINYWSRDGKNYITPIKWVE